MNTTLAQSGDLAGDDGSGPSPETSGRATDREAVNRRLREQGCSPVKVKSVFHVQ